MATAILAEDIVAMNARDARDAIRSCSSPTTLTRVIELEAPGKARARVAAAARARLATFIAEPEDELEGPSRAPEGRGLIPDDVPPAPPTAAATAPATAPHKVCPRCKVEATGEAEVERVFGFRNLKRRDDEGNVVKVHRLVQSYCRACRSAAKKARAKA